MGADMVDSVSSNTIRAGDLRIANVARVAAAPAVTTDAPASSLPGVQAPQTLARSMATKPPVDSERVAAIKSAIANGTFPLSPATIADQLIALKYAWMSHEQA